MSQSQEENQHEGMDGSVSMTAGMGTYLVLLALALIGGISAGLLVRAFIWLLSRWGRPLSRNRGWKALLACVGCFAWYPLHSIFTLNSVPISFLFALGMCTGILY
ncbi:hypothetical protein BZ163_01710 [Pseudomonas sp. VI4.1]|nr:hypothetical protein BZ163_01710 [Pseudomonas sp. VI4.1]